MTYQRCSLLAGGLIAALLIMSGPVLAEESASAEIDQRAKDPNQWPAPGRDNKLTRHSELKDIDTDNVKKLQMIWAQSTGALRGAEGQPIVIGDVGGKPMLFMVSGCPAMFNCNVVQALDLTDPDNPKQVWNYVKKTDRDESAVPRACCDTVNRGLNYAKGKVITHTLDGFVIALDALTGKELWVVKNAYPENGETETSPTLIAENLVIAGFGGDEFAARGRMTAYDLDTGKVVWTCHATGSDKDVCLTPETNKAHPEYGTYGKDLGISTYPGEDWKIGGQRAGAQILIAQGVEAGGHVRGTTSLKLLLPEVIASSDVPVLAAGGMVDGGDLVDALRSGAAGVVIGTAFLASPESFAHEYHKQRILDAQSQDTLLTDVFHINWPIGAPVRVLQNSTTRGERGYPFSPSCIIGEEEGRLIYLFSTDSPLRSMTGDFERMTLYAGQGVDKIDAIVPAGERLKAIISEATRLLQPDSGVA